MMRAEGAMTAPETSTTPPPEQAGQPGLHRRVGLFGASASGVGIVLGAGVYVLVGEAAGIAGNGVWLAFVVGALLAAGTGLAYAELASMLPEAGAAASYARVAFGPRVGFVTGWMNVTVNAIAAPAVAIGFARYFSGLVPLDITLITVAVLLLCAGIVLLGVAETVGVGSLFAAIEGAGLLIVIAVGLPYLGSADMWAIHGGAVGLLGAAALVFFAYEGFEEIATLSEEVRDPTRNIPRALLIAVVVTTVIYVTVAAVAVSVVPWQQLAETNAPLAEVVRVATSDRAADAISLIALFATFNTVLLLLATGPRVMYGMARRGMLPVVVGMVWQRRGTPWIAIGIVTAVSVAFALTGDIGFVAQVTNFAVFSLFASVNGSLLRLRFTRPDIPRPFRASPSIGRVSLPALVGLGGALGLAVFMDRAAFATGLVALALGVALSFVLVRPQSEDEGAAT
jgi:basic amino acid/polyamine antiporter, APA family